MMISHFVGCMCDFDVDDVDDVFLLIMYLGTDEWHCHVITGSLLGFGGCRLASRGMGVRGSSPCTW